MSEFTFKDGCMWEGYDWKISTAYECSEYGGGVPCKHCFGEYVKKHISVYGSSYIERMWICPSVVIAVNEGGHNSTGMCLQCIIEVAASLSNNSSESQ